MNRLNIEEKNLLTDFVRENFEVLFGIGAARGNQRRNELWQDVGNRLNAINPDTPARSTEQWKRTWRDLRKNAKQKLGKLREARNRTGCGEVPESAELNSSDEAIIEICGLNNFDGLPCDEEPGGEEYVEPTPPSPEFSPIICQSMDSSIGTIESFNFSVSSAPVLNLPLPETAQTPPVQNQTSLSTTPAQPQSDRQSGISQSRGAIRVRRQRDRISQILPARSQRYRDNDPRSESFSVASVTRQLQLQEETVGLLTSLKASQAEQLRFQEETVNILRTLMASMAEVLRILLQNQSRHDN